LDYISPADASLSGSLAVARPPAACASRAPTERPAIGCAGWGRLPWTLRSRCCAPGAA